LAKKLQSLAGFQFIEKRAQTVNMIREIDNCRIGHHYLEIVNDLRAELMTKQEDLIMAAHRTSKPKVQVLRHDWNPLQNGSSHPDYLERNPCFTELGKEL
jgi:hypothetical protein